MFVCVCVTGVEQYWREEEGGRETVSDASVHQWEAGDYSHVGTIGL